MAPAVEWTPDLSLGVEAIDEQHRNIFRAADRLLDASRAGKGRDAAVQTLDFLVTYAEQHLKDEEAEMRRVSYPELKAHQAEHAAFGVELRGFQRRAKKEGPSSELAVELKNFVLRWLRAHIKSTDRRFADFLLKGRTAAPADPGPAPSRAE